MFSVSEIRLSYGEKYLYTLSLKCINCKIETGLNTENSFAWVYDEIITKFVLNVIFACQDRLDLFSSALKDHVCRRLLQIEQAVKKGSRAPDFVRIEMHIKHVRKGAAIFAHIYTIDPSIRRVVMANRPRASEKRPCRPCQSKRSRIPWFLNGNAHHPNTLGVYPYPFHPLLQHLFAQLTATSAD